MEQFVILVIVKNLSNTFDRLLLIRMVKLVRQSCSNIETLHKNIFNRFWFIIDLNNNSFISDQFKSSLASSEDSSSPGDLLWRPNTTKERATPRIMLQHSRDARQWHDDCPISRCPNRMKSFKITFRHVTCGPIQYWLKVSELQCWIKGPKTWYFKILVWFVMHKYYGCRDYWHWLVAQTEIMISSTNIS